MYSDWGLLLWSVVFIWLSIITFLIWKQHGFLDKLFPESGERDVRKKFEDVIGAITDFKEAVNKAEGKIKDLQQQGLDHIQNIKLLRYNPYNDTGGDQSFTLSILDKKGTGIILTSLHARSGTRIFAKSIIEGESNQYKLSKEEEDVIKASVNLEK